MPEKHNVTLEYKQVAGTAAKDHIPSLSEAIKQTLRIYFQHLKGTEPSALYRLVMEQVEEPLFEIVMDRYRYNQSKAANALGMSRGTLRTKLKQHFKDKYVGSRNEDSHYSYEDPEYNKLSM